MSRNRVIWNDQGLGVKATLNSVCLMLTASLLLVGCTGQDATKLKLKKRISGITSLPEAEIPLFEDIPDLQGEPNSTVASQFKVNYFDEPTNCSNVISATSSNETLVSKEKIVITGITPDCKIEIVPVQGVAGTAEIAMVLITSKKEISKSIKVSFESEVEKSNVSSISIAPVDSQFTSDGMPINELPLTIRNSTEALDCASSIKATSSNSTLLDAASIVITGSFPDCKVGINPTLGQSGTAKITLMISSSSTVSSVEIPFTVDPIPTGGSPRNVVLKGQTWRVHEFAPGSSTFTVPASQTPRQVEYLIVGGGGSRGGGKSGVAWPEAGGGGAVQTGTITLNPGDYPIEVGAGGVIVTEWNGLPGGNGGASSAFSVTANGGLGGGRAANGTAEVGWSGASGSGQVGGFKWGTKNAGGGGGAGGSASITQDAMGGDGGIGIKSDFSGVLLGYGGGGGGGCYAYTGCNEGLATDGGGSVSVSPPSGQGGGAHGKYGSKDGGSGTVIVRYLLSNPNSVPSIASISEKIIDQGATLTNIPITITDPEDKLDCLSSLTASSSNIDLLPLSGITFSGSAPDCKMSLTPDASKSGRLSVTVNVSDKKSVASVTFAFEVIPTGATVLATGGEVSVISVYGVPYRVHTFKNDGADTLTVTRSNGATPIEYLIVGGGASCGIAGPGKYATPGGGGAVISGTQLVNVQSYPITVGGAGKSVGIPACTTPSAAGASSAFGFTANGGQKGTTTNGGASGNGNAGAAFNGSNSGGGGGAGGAGVTPGATSANGGIGVQSNITGSLIGYGGGGGGWGNWGTGPGVDGGGTCCGRSQVAPPNRGGGGPGHWLWPFGDGASGVVIVRYPMGEPNTPPALSIIPDQVTNSNNMLAGVDVTISDTETALACTSSLSATSSNATAIPNQNIVFSGTAPNCKMSLTPSINATGIYSVTVRLSDGKTFVEKTFRMEISP